MDKKSRVPEVVLVISAFTLVSFLVWRAHVTDQEHAARGTASQSAPPAQAAAVGNPATPMDKPYPRPMNAAANLPPPAPAAQEPAASGWFIADRNFTDCVGGYSPANRIRMFQEAGVRPSVKDLPNGAVEVTVSKGGDEEEFWTYFRSREACIANLPRSQAIPKRYE